MVVGQAMVVSQRVLLRSAIRWVLSSLEVATIECAEAPAAVEHARRASLDLVLADLDLHWDAAQPAGFAGWCTALPGGSRVIALAGVRGEPATARLPSRCQVLRADASPADLARIVSRALERRPPTMRLTGRQRDTLTLVAVGLTNEQIARELCITTGTVKRHLHDAFAALGASSRVEAVGRARCFGLI